MNTVTSRDGTSVVYDRLGQGEILILVGGALQSRTLDRVLGQRAEALSEYFRVIHYDRRGRGDSGDTLPYAIDREIEDLDALLDQVGAPADVFALSSGGVLALKAAAVLGDKIRKLALYDIPYNDEASACHSWKQFAINFRRTLGEEHYGDAVALFLQQLGTPAEQITVMRHHPLWAIFEATAPSLVYDIALMGEDGAIPRQEVSHVTVPTLVMYGTASHTFMPYTAQALVDLLPNGKLFEREGQTHAVEAEALIPVLVQFFST